MRGRQPSGLAGICAKYIGHSVIFQILLGVYDRSGKEDCSSLLLTSKEFVVAHDSSIKKRQARWPGVDTDQLSNSTVLRVGWSHVPNQPLTELISGEY